MLSIQSKANLCHTALEPNITFKFVYIPRPHPSKATYVHPYHEMCPPMLFKLRPCIQKNATPAHPCPPKTHRHGWAWVWAPNVTALS